MPLGSAPTSTINIDFTRAQGVNSTGRLIFQPMRLKIGTTILSTYPIEVEIKDGVGSVDLVRLPLGTYHARELIDGRPEFEFSFALPLSAASTIRYEDIAPANAVPSYFTAIRSVNGELPDPVTGDIEVASSGSVPDATTVVKGKLQLAGDLGGTASAPTVPGLLGKYVKPVGGIPSGDFATSVRALLALAATGVQPGELAPVATSGAYSSLTGKPSIPSVPGDIGAQPAGDYATNGALAGKLSLSVVDAAGDLVVGTADNTMARLAKGSNGQVLTVSGGAVGWGDPAGGTSTEFLSLCEIDGFVSWTGDPLDWTTLSGVGDGNTTWVCLPVPAGKALTKLWVAVGEPGSYAASSGKPNRLAIADDTSTILSLTPIDNTLYTVEGWRQATLITPQSAQSTPRWVYVGLIVGDMTNLKLRYPTHASSFIGTSETTTLNGGPATRRRAMYANGLSALPTSFDPATYGTVTAYMPLVAIS